MNFLSFFRRSLLLLTLIILAGVSILWQIERWHLVPDAAAGVSIGYGNALLGYALLTWGYKRSQHHFLISVYGGIIFRFLLIFLLLFLLIGALKTDGIALTVSLLVTYFLFMVLEIIQVLKISDKEKVSI